MNKFYIFGLLFFTLNAFSCSDLLDTDMRVLDSAESRNLCEFEGKALLVVNVASRCGYTYQYAGLQKLDRKSTRLNSSHRSLSRMPSSA